MASRARRHESPLHRPEPARGRQIYYSLPKNAEKVELKIVDITGATLRELPVASKEPGLYRVTWDLRPGTRPGNGPIAASLAVCAVAGAPHRCSKRRRTAAHAPPTEMPAHALAEPAANAGNQDGAEPAGDRPRGGGFGGRRAGMLSLGPGTYRVVLTVDGKEYGQNLRVEADPVVTDAVAGIDEPYADTREEEEEEMDQPGERDGGRTRATAGNTNRFAKLTAAMISDSGRSPSIASFRLNPGRLPRTDVF